MVHPLMDYLSLVYWTNKASISLDLFVKSIGRIFSLLNLPPHC